MISCGGAVRDMNKLVLATLVALFVYGLWVAITGEMMYGLFLGIVTFFIPFFNTNFFLYGQKEESDHKQARIKKNQERIAALHEEQLAQQRSLADQQSKAAPKKNRLTMP